MKIPHPREELREIVEQVKASLKDLHSWGIRDISSAPEDTSPGGTAPLPPDPVSPEVPGPAQTRDLFPGITPDPSPRSLLPAFGSLEEIEEFLKDCTRCQLSRDRNRLVFGVGNPQAEILFVGEGPGRDEDLKGEPFVGRAGKLLDKILASIELSRREVYIANIVKCRPPGNREPWPDEVSTCRPFLDAQILLINPRITVALGAPATRTLLGSKKPITQIRGTFVPFHIPRPDRPVWKGWLLPTYHPAFLLRNPGKKREVWEDMKTLREEYLHPGSKTAGAPG